MAFRLSTAAVHLMLVLGIAAGAEKSRRLTAAWGKEKVYLSEESSS